ncbi:hypothetical protein Msil_2173 [Methylocella silvestris BL2]|uniref:Uncharacterized protein n=2 Tax=Methylocella silvestris TaxID=199596 RepID=B8ESX3_METSB|nr:hypothetical protein Msil_2173 [Methylocella silvestris BL2]
MRFRSGQKQCSGFGLTRLEETVAEAYQKLMYNLATHDAREPDPHHVVQGPKTSDAVAKLVDRRSIKYLQETGVPFEALKAAGAIFVEGATSRPVVKGPTLARAKQLTVGRICMASDENLFDDQLAARFHCDATALCGEITGYFHRKQTEINEIIFVPLIIFARIVRLRDAALMLTQGGFPTEAGIIVLSQFEAKLDLAQSATDVTWAARWLEHQDTRHSLTAKITDAINKVFEDEADRSLEQSIFRHLSAMKHGNPVSSELGFQVRKDKGTITISTGEMDDATTATANTMISRYASYQLVWAARVLEATTARYAICTPATLQAIQEDWQSVSGYGTTFARFLESSFARWAGHLNFASGNQR